MLNNKKYLLQMKEGDAWVSVKRYKKERDLVKAYRSLPEKEVYRTAFQQSPTEVVPIKLYF